MDDDKPAEHSSGVDFFGEPKKTTRIGDKYQAQIPSFISENERLQLLRLPCEYDKTDIRLPCEYDKTDIQHQSDFGLSIPVDWVHNQHVNEEAAMETDHASTHEAAKGKSGPTTDDDMLAVPESSTESWSEIERDGFLLGLYIFGKNLRAVNKFVGEKGMRSVLSYYYGKFYKSEEHQKWSEHREKKSRKSAPGKKIFNGWRRRELFSRLLPNLTDECKASLTQATRKFEEGNLSFEDYVLKLRDSVGIHRLVQAVAIGKKKQDLTSSSRIKKQLKTKKLHTAISETQELVKLLRDGIGLSKASLNTLFWEAVWPRLLARGWHSEQPRNSIFQNSNHSLVFLAPGVAKFSRRSLERGREYFESFTDVLSKVASEPELLEREPRDGGCMESQPNQGSNDKQGSRKYTIVDSSLAGDDKVREIEFTCDVQALSSISGDSEMEESESRNEDVNRSSLEPDAHDGTEETDGVVDSEDKKMEISSKVQPVRKLKLVFKQKAMAGAISEDCGQECKLHNTGNKSCSGEDEAMEEPVAETEKKCPSLEGDDPLAFPELSSPGQRQSRRNRPLTTKALEALANGFLNPKRKKQESSRRRVRPKTALVASCGAPYIENRVDGGSSQSHMSQ